VAPGAALDSFCDWAAAHQQPQVLELTLDIDAG